MRALSASVLLARMSGSPEHLPIKRNTALLSAALAANSGMLQLSAAVASLTFVLVTGVKGLLGLGPAIVLASGALAALPAGRAMDRFGRVPVLATGFVVGALGGVLAAFGCASTPPFPSSSAWCSWVRRGDSLLARAAAEYVSPERRARGIAFVLAGAVFGAILGPAVFSPLLSGRELDGDSLALLWLAGSCFMLVGLALVVFVRPDPKHIAEVLAVGPERPSRGRPPPCGRSSDAPGRDSVHPRRPGELRGDGGCDDAHRCGRRRSPHPLRRGGLPDHRRTRARDVRTRARRRGCGQQNRPPPSARGRPPAHGPLHDQPSLDHGRARDRAGALLLGLGWNLSFVAATAQLADCSLPWERGKLLGFNDLLSGMTGAGLALLGGYALTAIGVAALAIGATALVMVPAVWIARRGFGRPVEASPTTADSRLLNRLGGRLPLRRFSV